MTDKRTWQERIDRARLRGYFCEEDKDRACMWSTCAVGEVFGPEHVDDYHDYRSYGDWVGAGLPRPGEIDAGIDFSRAVEDDDVEAAYALYLDILDMARERENE